MHRVQTQRTMKITMKPTKHALSTVDVINSLKATNNHLSVFHNNYSTVSEIILAIL